MLQRIQTVYLLLSVIISIAFFFVPISIVEIGESVFTIKASGIYYHDADQLVFDTPLLALSSVLVFHIFLTSICIFQFKNRPIQLKVTSLNLILLMVTLGLVFLRSGETPKNIASDADKIVTYSYGGLLLILPIVFTFLARRAILKDEKLVKSVDRLR